MPPQLVADMVVVIHLIFILFVCLGGLLVLCWPRLAYLHIPAALWGAIVEIQGWICPLTPIEHHFRQAAGHMLLRQGFVDHYIMPLVYPPGLTRKGQVLLGLLVVVVNLIIYAIVVVRQRQHRMPAPDNKKPTTDCQ